MLVLREGTDAVGHVHLRRIGIRSKHLFRVFADGHRHIVAVGHIAHGELLAHTLQARIYRQPLGQVFFLLEVKAPCWHRRIRAEVPQYQRTHELAVDDRGHRAAQLDRALLKRISVDFALRLRACSPFIAKTGERLAQYLAGDGVLHRLEKTLIDRRVLRTRDLQQVRVVIEALRDSDGYIVNDGLCNRGRLLSLSHIVGIVIAHDGRARSFLRKLHPEALDVALEPARPEDSFEQRTAHAVARALAIGEYDELLFRYRFARRGPRL